MRHVLCSWAELKHRKNLGEGINSQPEPQHLCCASQPGAKLVQLEVRELQGAKGAFVQRLSVLTSARQPDGDGCLPVAENPFRSGWVQPFGQCRQHHCDLLRRCFQPIQWGMASGTERGVASLTTKRLDPLSRAMLAIPNESMEVSVCDTEVETLAVRTSKALRVYAFGSTSMAFHLAPGANRQRRWSYTR